MIVPHLFGTAAFQEAALRRWRVYVHGARGADPVGLSQRCRFVVISESTRDDLIRRGIARGRITVVHCGMDHDTYRADPATWRRRAQPTVVYVGRLRRYKGIDWVLRALSGGAARACRTRGST